MWKRWTDEVEGLYAAGECAVVWSVHGANRLGGNALMETITYGKRVGRHAADWALANTDGRVPPSVEADAERELRSCSIAAKESGPGRSATSWPDRCTRTSVSSAAEEQMRKAGGDRGRAEGTLRARHR